MLCWCSYTFISNRESFRVFLISALKQLTSLFISYQSCLEKKTCILYDTCMSNRVGCFKWIQNPKIKQKFHENWCYYFDNGWGKFFFLDFSNYPWTKLVNKNVFDVSTFISIARMTKFEAFFKILRNYLNTFENPTLLDNTGVVKYTSFFSI